MIQRRSILDHIIYFCLTNKFVVVLLLALFVFWGIRVAPFDWNIDEDLRDPVPTDAIPDIGENQQIVFTEWMGRSPQDVEDQITYPLTVSLLGVPGVKTVRSYSMFGFSSIYVIFNEDVEYYWSRTRVLEKLNSLPTGTLPEGVQPMLGPDATALGQVFWYTLECRDQEGNPSGGWGLDELRSVQDWTVRYALQSAEGVSEVASIGGFVREYQIDVDPDAMRAYGVQLADVFNAVRMSNLDVGARSIEVNRVEYFVRGIGFVKDLDDLELAVVKVNDNVPISIKEVANVSLGPALRRGVLDKEGAEAVGGVVVVRYGENPLAAIKNIKAKIAEISPGLPKKAVIDWRKVDIDEVTIFASERGFNALDTESNVTLAINQSGWKEWLETAPANERPEWLTLSTITIVPFYDRTGLINETLGTLNTAIYQEILITIIVVLIMVRHLGSSTLISGLLPLAVLMTFIAMRQFGVDANIVALSGIAIAIGTMVDMGIVISENILRRLKEADEAGQPTSGAASLQIIFTATSEVASAVLTAVATTIVGFLPVFAMEAAEGKLFKPLAFTKTFALVAAIIVALTLIPPFAHLIFSGRIQTRLLRRIFYAAIAAAGIQLLFFAPWWVGALMLGISLYKLSEGFLPAKAVRCVQFSSTWLIVILVGVLLSGDWLPLGPEKGFSRNLIFVAVMIGGLLGLFHVFQRFYIPMLRWTLNHKLTFLSIPTALIIFGATTWLGFERLFGWLPQPLRTSAPVSYVAHKLPGLGKEFMPSLDEGSFLFMPTTSVHASITEATDVLQKQDMAISAIPEVNSVVGKLGRAESPLDPAPISMFETVVNYHPQYLSDAAGRRLRFQFDADETDYFRDVDGAPVPAPDGQPFLVRGKFTRDGRGQLVPDSRGSPFRLWRPALDPDLNEGPTYWPGVQNPDDIWEEIIRVTAIPGTTSAPKLQPIATRLVMLQTGMRAPLGVKVKGPTLEAIEQVGIEIEQLLKQVSSVQPETVVADRIVGKPYLEIEIDREAIARYGLSIGQVQEVIEVAVGGKRITTTVEGRERYPVRVRYLRELRDQIETLGRILVPSPQGAQIPLTQLASIHYLRGPQMIKSEDTFKTGYVVFDMKPGEAEVDVVEDCRAFLEQKMASGEFSLPDGVSFTFAGSYENQVRAMKKLMVVVPLALFIIFLILYLQFRSTITALLVFSGIFVAWSGGFIMLWCYAQPWFFDFSIFGTNLRDLFQMSPINLSVAVWVGFLALFGIATDDGVLMATMIGQQLKDKTPADRAELHEAVLAGAQRRIRPALMTSATTILALLPVLTSTGRGSDIMVPMAIPSFGGMAVAMITVFVVPVLYCWVKELQWKLSAKTNLTTNAENDFQESN